MNSNDLVLAYRAALSSGDRRAVASLQTTALRLFASDVARFVADVAPACCDEARQVARLGVLVGLEIAARDGGDLDALVRERARAELETWARKVAA